MIVGRVDVRRAVSWPPLAGLALVGALIGPAQLAVHHCVAGAGPVGWLGLRLALLRTSADCPDGALAVGGSGAHGALVVVSVAVPTLLAHVLAVAGGLGLSALLAQAASGIRLVLRAVLHVLPGAPRVPWVRAALVAAREIAVVRTRALPVRHWDRGPPALSVV